MTIAQASDAGLGIHPSPYRLPRATRVGRVRLAVSSLVKSVAFYSDVIGLSVLSQDLTSPEQLAYLGIRDKTVGEDTVLLELQQPAGVKSIEGCGRLGLYHTAFLLPTREALARFVLHLTQKDIPFASADHLFSEAIYLVDPDGLTVEVYADRPREQWTVDGRELVGAVNPLRLQGLVSLAKDRWNGAPVGITIGHVHFFVGDLSQAKNFYHQALGLDMMTWRLPSALFLAAGGYHHHVGVNTWAAGSPPASASDARLLFWQRVLPGEEDVKEAVASFRSAGYSGGMNPSGDPTVTDPWGIEVALVHEGC